MAWGRRLWDVLYSAASTGIALLLGVVLGNVLQGMPLDERGEFSGSWLSFLNPYALLVGVMALALLMVHGAIYLIMKTEGKLYEKLTRLVRWAMVAFGVLFLGVTAYTLAGFPHLYARFMAQPSGALLPLLAILAILNVPRLLSKGRYRRAFLFSSLTVA
ncbi:MAG TPA: cytochrome d ubiquinol oxidase subunit II, partial [Cytophagales bacterium]|nr:cytochrome d ubiquinol oxidase subunit II [Cytophagales bacterium]